MSLERDMGPETPYSPLQMNMGPEIPYPPCEQIDRQLWKHYLPATTVVSGNKIMNLFVVHKISAITMGLLHEEYAAILQRDYWILQCPFSYVWCLSSPLLKHQLNPRRDCGTTTLTQPLQVKSRKEITAVIDRVDYCWLVRVSKFIYSGCM